MQMLQLPCCRRSACWSRKANTIWPRNCNAKLGAFHPRPWNAGCSTTARACNFAVDCGASTSSAVLRPPLQQRAKITCWRLPLHCSSPSRSTPPFSCFVPTRLPTLTAHRLNRPWPKPLKPRKTGLVPAITGTTSCKAARQTSRAFMPGSGFTRWKPAKPSSSSGWRCLSTICCLRSVFSPTLEPAHWRSTAQAMQLLRSGNTMNQQKL